MDSFDDDMDRFESSVYWPEDPYERWEDASEPDELESSQDRFRDAIESESEYFLRLGERLALERS